MTFVERIDDKLKDLRIGRKDLCEAVGITTQSITDWSKKGTKPSVETILKIARFLDTSVEYIMSGESSMGTSITEKDYKLIGYFHKVPDEMKNIVLDFTFKLSKLSVYKFVTPELSEEEIFTADKKYKKAEEKEKGIKFIDNEQE